MSPSRIHVDLDLQEHIARIVASAAAPTPDQIRSLRELLPAVPVPEAARAA